MKSRILCIAAMLLPVVCNSQASLEPSDITQVVLLGTGTPNVDPERSRPQQRRERLRSVRGNGAVGRRHAHRHGEIPRDRQHEVPVLGRELREQTLPALEERSDPQRQAAAEEQEDERPEADGRRLALARLSV